MFFDSREHAQAGRARAFATRVRSGTKKSPSRVIATRRPLSATIISRSRRPIASVTVFS